MKITSYGPVLVTGAAGRLSAAGQIVTGLLLERGLPVRAVVRCEGDPAEVSYAAGAEVFVGNLLNPPDVHRVVSGARCICFGMSVSAGYLETSVTMATDVRDVGVETLVSVSRMTVRLSSVIAICIIPSPASSSWQ